MNPIFDYTNYRKYLQDYYQWAKVNVRGFSHRAFLAKAEMSGPNYLKRVMEGVHNLTESSISKFAKALDLSETEATFFKYLVFFNQARTLDEKDRYFEILIHLKSPHSQHVLEKFQYDYYKDWYNIAIREILSYFPYKDKPAELAKEIAPPISPKKVKKALELLERLGLIERREGGSYALTSRAITTGSEVRSLLVPKFHITMAKLAAEAVTRFHKDERYFSSISMSFSEEGYREVIRLIRDLRKKVIQRVAEETDPDRAYHLNLQLFPMSRPKSKRRRKNG
ncbi:TIGR02147 family protein [Fibrobacterota bacterium]